jgi:hypothetical protein
VPLWLVYDRVTWVGVLLRIASKSSTNRPLNFSSADRPERI